MDKPAVIYARVSSDQQKENHTIQSQTAALIKYAKTHGYAVPPHGSFGTKAIAEPLCRGLDWKPYETWLLQAR
jgi:hypothetical protein